MYKCASRARERRGGRCAYALVRVHALRRRAPPGLFQPVTGADGTRVYLSRELVTDPDEEVGCGLQL